MNEFVASNGCVVRSNDNGLYMGTPDYDSARIYPNGAQALREFFLNERDAELGRWRSKEHPEFAIYGRADAQFVDVLNEQTGWMHHTVTGSEKSDEWIPGQIAREFFAAHPEPKPWHDAKPGEKWLLTVYGAEHEFFIRSDGGSQIFAHRLDTSAEYKITGDTGVITAGRRIRPEV